MQTLYTLAFPTLSDADRGFIEQFRNRHDVPHKDLVAAHFTLVFGCFSVPESEYVAHVRTVAASAHAIRFSCRYAMLGAEREGSTAHVFLVPDEGYSELSKLHDRLYENVLASQLRLDIPYIPHITIGTLDDVNQAKQLCDTLNTKGLEIHGKIDAITVCSHGGKKIAELATFDFGEVVGRK